MKAGDARGHDVGFFWVSGLFFFWSAIFLWSLVCFLLFLVGVGSSVHVCAMLCVGVVLVIA